MGILGEPDAELVDLLGVIEEIQQRARRPIRRGAVGAEIFAAAHEPVDASSHRVYLDFMAHGMGLVSHEATRLIDYKGAYEGYDATRPLEADMVISIETTMAYPKRGFIKLEDIGRGHRRGLRGLRRSGAGLESGGITIHKAADLVDLENCTRDLPLRKRSRRISSSKAFSGEPETLKKFTLI
jgi:Xaa-Pro aminopeptidase